MTSKVVMTSVVMDSDTKQKICEDKNAQNIKKKVKKCKPKVKSYRQVGIEASAAAVGRSRTRSHGVVMELIERRSVTAEQLEQMCLHITPEQWEDVCVERCIAGVCGLPTCSNDHKDTSGTRLYRIHENTLYDIIHRRNMCSGRCYTAWAAVRRQVPETPLFLRKAGAGLSTEGVEAVVPIIVPNHRFLPDTHGDPVDLAGDVEREHQLNRKRRSSHHVTRTTHASKSASVTSTPSPAAATSTVPTPSSALASASIRVNKVVSSPCPAPIPTSSLAQTPDPDSIPTCSPALVSTPSLDSASVSASASPSTDVPTISSTPACDISPTSSSTEGRQDSREGAINKTSPTELLYINTDRNASCNINETPDANAESSNSLGIQNLLHKMSLNKEEKYQGKIPENNEDHTKKESAAGPTKSVLRIEECLQQWLGWEALLFLLGRRYLRGFIHHHLHRPHHDGLPDRPQDHHAANEGDTVTTLHPPDDAASYQPSPLDGITTLSNATEDATPCPDCLNLPDEDEDNDDEQDKSEQQEEQEQKEDQEQQNEEEEQGVHCLPLIDKLQQDAWRRTIVIEKLDHAQERLLPLLRLQGAQLRPVMSGLVACMNLTAATVALAPSQWTLTLLILLRLLMFRYGAVATALSGAGGGGGAVNRKEVNAVLSTHGLPSTYLNDLFSRLTNTDFILPRCPATYTAVTGPSPITTNSDTVPRTTTLRVPAPTSLEESDEVSWHHGQAHEQAHEQGTVRNTHTDYSTLEDLD